MTISPQNVQPKAPVAPVAPQVIESKAPVVPAEHPPSQWQFKADAGATAPQTAAPRRQDAEGTISWTGSEFIAHEKSAGWYGMLAGGAILLAAIVFVLTHDKISTAVVIVTAAVLGYFGARKPRTLDYKLDDNGVSIGTKFYVYDLFKSFSVVDEGTVSGIVLMPMKRFMPQLTLYYAPADEEKIVNMLADRLPMEEHKTDVVDRFMHRIRF